MSCHEDVYKKRSEGTPHFQTTQKDGHGCESCHGPGAEHVAGGGDKSKIVCFADLSRSEASQRCLECHGQICAQRHTHNFIWHAGWSYYQYGEKAFVGPTSPRYFHANNATISLKYAV